MGAILRELARHDPSTAVTLSMHSHLVAFQVWRHRHGMDARGLLRKVVEAAPSSSAPARRTGSASNGTTRRVDGGYVVSARKGPASGCEVGDVLVTSIRWDDAPDGPQVLHCSIPFAADGVGIDLTWDTLGLRATGSHTVVLDDVFVPDAAVSLTRPADQWHPVWNIVVGAALPLIMSAYLGVADAAVEHTLDGRPRAPDDPRAPTGRRDAQRPHDGVRRHRGDVPGVSRQPAVRQHRRARPAGRSAARRWPCEAVIETVRLAIEASGGPATPAAATSSGCTATSTAACSTRWRRAKQTAAHRPGRPRPQPGLTVRNPPADPARGALSAAGR